VAILELSQSGTSWHLSDHKVTLLPLFVCWALCFCLSPKLCRLDSRVHCFNDICRVNLVVLPSFLSFLRRFRRSSTPKVNYSVLTKRWAPILLPKLSENSAHLGK